MDIIFDLSIYHKLGIYIAIGLLVLLIALHVGLQDPFEREEIRERIGQVILMTVLLWPYNLIHFIFSRPFWYQPIGEMITIGRPVIVNTLVLLPGSIIILFLLAEMFGLIEFRLP